MMTDGPITLAKLGFTSLTMMLTAASVSINDISVPVVGTSLTAITMSALGVSCSYAWPTGETKRGRFFLVVIACTFIGATAVTVIPQWLTGHQWPRELQPPLAFLFGLLAPWVVPALRTVIPALFKGVAAMIVRIYVGKIDDRNYPKE
jgi:hypothetical protein